MKNKKRIIIGLLFVVALTGGGLTVAIADTSISGMLSTWLSNKTDESIHEIDKEIQEEQEKQTERLKAEVQASIDHLENEMNAFVEKEKQKRITAIEDYADALLTEITVDEFDGTTEIEKELDRIYQGAIEEINALHDNQAGKVLEEQEE